MQRHFLDKKLFSCKEATLTSTQLSKNIPWQNPRGVLRLRFDLVNASRKRVFSLID